MPGSEDMVVLARLFDLLAWLLPKSESFPRAHRHTVTRRMMDAAQARIAHRFAAAAADLPGNPALRSVRVLDVLFKYACAPGLSRALSCPASPRPRFANR